MSPGRPLWIMVSSAIAVSPRHAKYLSDSMGDRCLCYALYRNYRLTGISVTLVAAVVMGTASASRRRFAISSKRPTGCLSSNGLLGDGVGAEHAVGDAGTEGMIGGM